MQGITAVLKTDKQNAITSQEPIVRAITDSLGINRVAIKETVIEDVIKSAEYLRTPHLFVELNDHYQNDSIVSKLDKGYLYYEGTNNQTGVRGWY